LGNWSLSVALGVSLILGGLLGHSSLAGAQPVSPAADPGFFPATGYRVSSPAVLSYFQHRGAVRTFGYPVSNEFPLLGKRVQIFQRQMLELSADGTVTPANILDPDVLPIDRIDGLNLPPTDPDLVASAPSPANPDYTTQAISYLSVYVPDEWNGLQVNFQTTFLNSVTCADAFGSDPCETSLLPAFALELWGLPTSLPTTDPLNQEFVYQRFQRGIMHFSRATGLTQGLLLGDWLKRVMIGVDLSADLGPAVRHSPFFAQYAPSRPLALDRPNDLPDSSLAQAFRAETLSAAGQMQPEPALPSNVAQTATAVALTATAITATQAALQGTQAVLTATALAATATAAASNPTPTPTPVTSSNSSIPVVNIGCMGDEQMWFVPRRPNVGTHVDISVTSQRHHDVRSLKLAGPLDPGPVTERVGPLGFVWTWTIVPAIEAFHEWTFYADGLRPCITSGFNSFAPLGATPTATITPQATNTPGPTATPTPTVIPVPSITRIVPESGPCGSLVTIFGHGFGSPPSTFGTSALISSPSDGTHGMFINGGSDTSLSAQIPSTGLTGGGTTGTSHTVQVVSNGGVSNTVVFTVTGGASNSQGTPTTTC
jgi:hypothetical protein